MKQLNIPRLDRNPTDLQEADALLNQAQQHSIDTANWPAFTYCPEVHFALAYSNEALFLRFAVHEDAVLAEKTTMNSDVCQDSCVEMFFSPRENRYINFEFNCIGTALVGSGSSRTDSQLIDATQISQIDRHSTLGTEPFAERGESSWRLIVKIPFTLMQIDSPAGKSYRANFYKCGDKLSKPHYLTWNPVGTPQPDFHQPEYFGLVRFQE